MNSRSSPDVVRFGALVLVTLASLLLLVEGAKFTRSYSLTSKPRPKPREIRGLRPDSLSTAIGFGKRESSFRSSDLDRRSSSDTLSPQKEIPQRFPIFWFLEYLKSNPDVARRVERQLLSGSEEEDKEMRSSSTRCDEADDAFYLEK